MMVLQYEAALGGDDEEMLAIAKKLVKGRKAVDHTCALRNLILLLIFPRTLSVRGYICPGWRER